MGLFGRIASAFGAGVRKVGEFGSAALGKIGHIKTLYDKVNNAVDGIIGETLEKLPVVGPALKHVGSFLNDSNKLASVNSGLRTASGIGDEISRFGHSIH